MTLNDLKLRARALLRPNRVEQELDEELTFHIEREARKLIDEGMTPAEARERAQPQFQIVECHASFITRPMAFDMRSHARASSAS